MIEAGAPSTWKSCKCAFRGVRAPPGVVMVAPQTLLRKAEEAQSEGRVVEVGSGEQRGQQCSIKAGAPKSPGPMIPTPTSPRSTQRLTTPTDGTPPLARSIALCPHG